MNNQNINTNLNSMDSQIRKKRVNRARTAFMAVVITLLLIPILLCVGLFIKVQKLEDKMESIIAVDNGSYADNTKDSEDPLNKGNNSVAFAAETDDVEYDENSSDNNLNKTNEENTEDVNFKEEELILTPEEKLDIELDSKKVYLTFDDGPGQYTAELLDILAENNVKATFFVIGKEDSNSKAMYKRIVEEGHTLAMHSYSHQYKKIYKSIKEFDMDFNKLSDLLYESTGIRPTMYRFPGGSSNLVSGSPMTDFVAYLNDKSITYYDWNVINGDATGKSITSKQMIQNVMTGVKGNNNSTVLMHDSVSKDTTITSLQELIDQLKKEGYVILPITKYTKPVQHIKADSIE